MSKVASEDISKHPSAPYTVLSSSDPVIVTAVAVAQYPGSNGAGISAAVDDSQENLMDIVHYLEQELHLNGTVISVVDEACRQLGVSSGGPNSSLYERAVNCRDIIQGKPTTSAGTVTSSNYHEPNSGPRGDQLGAFKWFEDQGWKDKWPVHYASMKGQVEEIIRLVQQSGRRPDEKMTDWFDSEPVGWAASFGQLGALRCLIDLGAYPFTVNKSGNTALTDAKRERHEGCIVFLENYQKSPGSASAGMKMDRDVMGGRGKVDLVEATENELVEYTWSGGKACGGSEGYDANPWSFTRDKRFVTLRDGCNGQWSLRKDSSAPGGIILRMDWKGGQSGNYAEFALQQHPNNIPAWKCTGSSSYGFMRSWTIRRGNAIPRGADASAGDKVRTAVTPNPALNGELNSTARNTNDTAKIRDLVARGAVLESVNDRKCCHTALHQACFHNRPAIVRTLLELGAYEKCAHLDSNPCGRSWSGLPIELARGSGHHEIVKILEEYARNHGGGADASAVTPTGNPALNGELNSTARNTNDTAKIRDLVARGAVLESVNDGHWRCTALHQACYHGRTAIVRTLLELGAYEKCAHLAANPCGRGGSGLPIEMARGGGHHEIVTILEEYARNHGGGSSSAAAPSGPPPPPPICRNEVVSPAMQDLLDPAKHPNGPSCCNNFIPGIFCMPLCLATGSIFLNPLHCMSMWICCAPCIPCVAACFDPNGKNPHWFQSGPLGWAASFGHMRIVQELVRAGANPLNPPNGAGETTRSDARREGHYHIVVWVDAYERVRREDTQNQ